MAEGTEIEVLVVCCVFRVVPLAALIECPLGNVQYGREPQDPIDDKKPMRNRMPPEPGR